MDSQDITQMDQATQYLPVQLSNLPPYHEVHRTHIPTITHVPKGAITAWTALLTSVANRVSYNPSSIANHILLNMLARAILPAGKSPPHPGDSSQATKVKERIKRWKEGEYRALWEEAIALQEAPKQKKGRGKKKPEEEEISQEVRNARRSHKLIIAGQYTGHLKRSFPQGWQSSQDPR